MSLHSCCVVRIRAGSKSNSCHGWLARLTGHHVENPKTIIRLSQATPRLHDPCFDSFSTNRHRGVALRNSDHFRSIKNRFLSVELLYSTFEALPSPRLNATQSLHKESDVSDLGHGLFDLARHSTPPQPA